MRNRLIYYTIKQTSDMLQLEETAVYRYVRTGRLVASKMGGEWRITREAIQSFYTAGLNNKDREEEAVS